MCGEKALQYVRFRHADTDIMRAARQQDFLREARQKIGARAPVSRSHELIKIFTKYTTSDIEDPQTMLEVLKLFLSVADAPIKEVHFQGSSAPPTSRSPRSRCRRRFSSSSGPGRPGPAPRGGASGGGGDGGGGGGREPEPDRR